MEKVDIDELGQAPLSGPTDRRPVSEALGATAFVLMYYELEPGDGFSGGYHTHHDQEEAFYVLSGTATFDTEEGEVKVGSGESIRFAPGEFQHGYNDGDERVEALAIGAPPGMNDTETVFRCPGCGETTHHGVELDEDEGVVETECLECGAETRTEV